MAFRFDPKTFNRAAKRAGEAHSPLLSNPDDAFQEGAWDIATILMAFLSAYTAQGLEPAMDAMRFASFTDPSKSVSNTFRRIAADALKDRDLTAAYKTSIREYIDHSSTLAAIAGTGLEQHEMATKLVLGIIGVSGNEILDPQTALNKIGIDRLAAFFDNPNPTPEQLDALMTHLKTEFPNLENSTISNLPSILRAGAGDYSPVAEFNAPSV
ncbi:MAG: hypothetical protein ACRBCT_09785 [Alphaproteobacteria bacterium]